MEHDIRVGGGNAQGGGDGRDCFALQVYATNQVALLSREPRVQYFVTFAGPSLVTRAHAVEVGMERGGKGRIVV